MSAAQARLLLVDGLEVWVTRKRIKNINLRVKPPAGRIEVSAPYHTSDASIANLVREKRRWIDANVREIVNSPRSRGLEASPAEVAQWKAAVAACPCSSSVGSRSWA